MKTLSYSQWVTQQYGCAGNAESFSLFGKGLIDDSKGFDPLALDKTKRVFFVPENFEKTQ